jgi:hypothetical protein
MTEGQPLLTWLAGGERDVTRVRRIIMLGIDFDARDEVASKHARYNLKKTSTSLWHLISPVLGIQTLTTG